MTPLDLQDTIIAELKQLFDGQLFPQKRETTDDPEKTVPLNFYPQALPYKEGYDFANYAPYISVQLHNGRQEEETEPADAIVLLNIGIYDDSEDNQGHVMVMNIIETIRQDLFKKRTLGGKYSIKLPFEWELNDEDVWPYFIGSVETHWNMPIMQPEDENI